MAYVNLNSSLTLMAKMKTRVNVDEDAQHLGLSCSAGECGKCHNLSGKLAVPTSAILFLGIYPRDTRTQVYKKPYTRMFTAALSSSPEKCISPGTRQQESGLTKSSIFTPWTAVPNKKALLLTHATTWMNPKTIMLQRTRDATGSVLLGFYL